MENIVIMAYDDHVNGVPEQLSMEKLWWMDLSL